MGRNIYLGIIFGILTTTLTYAVSSENKDLDNTDLLANTKDKNNENKTSSTEEPGLNSRFGYPDFNNNQYGYQPGFQNGNNFGRPQDNSFSGPNNIQPNYPNNQYPNNNFGNQPNQMYPNTNYPNYGNQGQIPNGNQARFPNGNQQFPNQNLNYPNYNQGNINPGLYTNPTGSNPNYQQYPNHQTYPNGNQRPISNPNPIYPDYNGGQFPNQNINQPGTGNQFNYPNQQNQFQNQNQYPIIENPEQYAPNPQVPIYDDDRSNIVFPNQ